MNPEQALQARLKRTWGAFFRRFGTFTASQQAAIPLILEGENIVLSAPTASGKTEAVLAPLIENYLPPLRSAALRLLYVLPTRALIHDLQTRLLPICETLQVTLAVKTYDANTFNYQHSSDILLTTPESLDSLLANQPKLLLQVQAVILDELHQLDGTPRGDQLRLLLNRLRQIRDYAAHQGDAPDAKVQYVALSATMAQAASVAERYFPHPTIVTIAGSRPIQAESIPLDAMNPQSLIAYFSVFQARSWRKALAFCNTRAEVEAYAAFVRQAQTVFGEQVFTHYSNLSSERRYAIESQFAASDAAICFATNTLELGIDIGSIDTVLLIGAPPDSAAFLQRLGRANRRQRFIQAAYFYRSLLEQRLFEVLPDVTSQHELRPFRPAVAIQQIFSLLKQSPNLAIRLAPLAKLFDGLLSAAELENILGHLQTLDYLKSARLGEWRAGAKLNRLIDQQGYTDNPLSIYSNIDSAGQQSIDIRDKYSQKILAKVDKHWLSRASLTLEGQTLDVMWQDKRSLWVAKSDQQARTEKTLYLSSRQALQFEIAQVLGAKLGWQKGAAPFVADAEGGVYLFHWLGDVYGRIFYDLIRPHQVVYETRQIGLCLYFAELPTALPLWRETIVRNMLERSFMRYESWLQLGAYQFLLTKDLRCQAVLEQLQLGRLLAALNALKPQAAGEHSAILIDLLS
jgi:ATP-dependent Lhr-like helicase